MERNARRHGFTLIELLITIAIIGILAAMLIPAANYIREKARKTECLNNLRQWGVALQGYLDEHRGIFPSYAATISAPDAWFNVIPPYIGVTPLKDMAASGKVPHPGNGLKSVFLCPSESVGLDGANAAQNTSQGSIHARYDYINDQLVITIDDTGSGIPEEALNSIYDRFVSGKAGGTGLGLSICSELMRQMGGSIKIKSKPDKGTTVWITLPCQATEIERN